MNLKAPLKSFLEIGLYERYIGNMVGTRWMTWGPITYKKREEKPAEAKVRNVQRKTGFVRWNRIQIHKEDEKRLLSLIWGNGISKGVKEETKHLQSTSFGIVAIQSTKRPCLNISLCVPDFARCVCVSVGRGHRQFGVHCDPTAGKSPVPTAMIALHPHHSFKHSWSFFTWAELDSNLLKDKNVTFFFPSASFLPCRLSVVCGIGDMYFQTLYCPFLHPSPTSLGPWNSFPLYHFQLLRAFHCMKTRGEKQSVVSHFPLNTNVGHCSLLRVCVWGGGGRRGLCTLGFIMEGKGLCTMRGFQAQRSACWRYLGRQSAFLVLLKVCYHLLM